MPKHDFEDFVELVADMRRSQKDYFRQRDRQALSHSKELERRVDQAVEDHQQKQKQLF